MSSKPTLLVRNNARWSVSLPALFALFVIGSPLAAQDDEAMTEDKTEADSSVNSASPETQSPPAEQETEEEETPLRINLAVTVPRGEVNEAQARECVDRADAGTISNEIVVCRRRGEDRENYYSGSREEAQKRYAEETAFKGDPRTPNTFGIPNHGNPISIGGVPPPALIIDVEALPTAPAGSDADRIARGLPPLGQDENLSEEEIKKRREALGLPPPAFEKKPR